MKLKIKVIFFVFSSLLCLYLSGCTKSEPKSEPKPMKIGVIDPAKVLKEHRDWKRLEVLDKKLADLQARMAQANPSLNELGMKQAERMKQAQAQAEKELKAQLLEVQASLERHKREIASQLEKEASSARMKMKKLAASGEPAARPSSPEKAKSLTNDLIVLRDRQVTAKRLELQKTAKERMDVMRTKLENELAAYERQISKENQQQRLNIQLKLQLDPPEEEKKALTEELSAITEEESALKDRKKQEIGNQIEQTGAKELADIEKEVAAYKDKIDKDIKRQIGFNPSGSNQASAPNQSELEKKSRQIAGEFAQKQRALEAQLSGATASSQRMLENKQAELQKRLKELQAGMMKEMEQSREQLARSDMERLNKLKTEFDAVAQQREKLYNAMADDLKSEVAKMADTDGYTAIFLSYIANVKATDLTEQAIKAVKAANSSASEPVRD